MLGKTVRRCEVGRGARGWEGGMMKSSAGALATEVGSLGGTGSSSSTTDEGPEKDGDMLNV